MASTSMQYEHEEEHMEMDIEMDMSDVEQGPDLSAERWRDLAKIVQDLSVDLTAKEDLEYMHQAVQIVEAKDHKREEEIAEMNAIMNQLNNQYDQAAVAAQRPVGTPTPAEHNSEVRRLEHEDYTTRKRLIEEQTNMGKKEAELGKWKSEREDVGRIEVGEGDSWDGGVIRLKMFSGMGFNLTSGSEGDIIKMLVGNEAKSEVFPVTIDKSRSKAHYANLLWNMASD